MVIIGEKIKMIVKKSDFTIIEFARKINTNRNNVYDIFKRKTIDTGLLKKIGEVLDYDFFRYYITEKTKAMIVNDKKNIYITSSEIKKLNRKITQLEKEIEVLQDRLKDKEDIIQLLKNAKK